MGASFQRFLVLAFLVCLVASDVAIDYALGNEIKTIQVYTLLLSLLSYALSAFLWWKTKVNALVPIGVLILFSWFSLAYYPATFPLILGGIGVPLVGSLLLLSIMRYAYRSKVGRSNVFERR